MIFKKSGLIQTFPEANLINLPFPKSLNVGGGVIRIITES